MSSDKAILTCALTGVLTNPKQHPVPVTPEEMAQAAHDAYQAGASIVHCHFRQQEPGIWVATAFGGHGLNTTAMAGELVAAGITQKDERWKDFDAFPLRWNGGWFGQLAVQGSYFWMQLKDAIREQRAMRAIRQSATSADGGAKPL